jgi:hypothetical protein
MTILTEGQHTGEFLVSEAPGARSRETLTIGRSQTLVAGQVVALIPTDTGAVTVGAPAFTGTGDGTCTRANPAYGAGVQEGTYIVRFIEAVAHGGNFQVIRPDGTIDGLAIVGVAYAGQIAFTLADGGTDFSDDAQFTLAVSIANATNATKYIAYNQDGTDGSAKRAANREPLRGHRGGTAKGGGSICRHVEICSHFGRVPADLLRHVLHGIPYR